MVATFPRTTCHTRPLTGGNFKKIAFLAIILALVASVVSGISYLEHHSNREHNPNIKETEARRAIDSFLVAMSAYLAGNGQDPRKGCGFVSDATGIQKVSLFVYDIATNNTYLLWFFVNKVGTPLKGPWGGAFPHDDINRFEKGPKDLKEGQNWTFTTDMSQCPTAPSFLQIAQP
mgnify:FL=1